MHYQSWSELSDEELASRDIAEVNLAAAVGLPMADPLDMAELLAKLNGWARQVRQTTNKALRQRAVADRDLSDSQFRMMALVTVLQRDLGVRYSLAFSEAEYDARDSRNLFLHGLLTGHGGTCVTMPVLYAAIGRRLGYPIKLAFAKDHVFCRWETPFGERFNIEATSQGFHAPDDDYYLRWPFPIKAEERGNYLYSLTPRQELAFFLSRRGHCWLDHLLPERGVEAIYWAARNDSRYDGEHMIATFLWHIIQRIRINWLPDNIPIGDAIALNSPHPRDDLEQRGLAIAQEQLMRIFKHRAAEAGTVGRHFPRRIQEPV